jgi:type IV pilus assembly protein PilA
MLIKLRKRMAREESGFTLIELLVVMLILGILAAIAIPAFLSQREKGQDSDAKAGVRTMESAAETYLVENGNYGGMDKTDLVTIEPAVNDVPNFAAATATPSGDNKGYTIVVTSESQSDGRTFTLEREGGGVGEVEGTKNRTCTPNGGGCVGGGW